MTSETETSDTNTGSYDYRLFSRTTPFTRPVHRDTDSGNECGTAFSPYQSVKKKSLYEFSDTAQSEDDQIPTYRELSENCNGWRCNLSSCVSANPSSYSLATLGSSKSNVCTTSDRPTSTTTVIQRSYTTANTPTNVDTTPTPTPYHINSSSEDYTNLQNNVSDKDSINEETHHALDEKAESLEEEPDNPGPRLSWSPKPSKKRIGRGRSMRRDDPKCPAHHPDDKVSGYICTTESCNS